MRIKEIYMQTSKPEEVEEFYRNILELKTETGSSANIEIFTGYTKIIFEKATQNNPIYHFAFNIPSNKIKEACDWLSKRVELLWIEDHKSYIADFKNWNAKSIYFIDPAGNIVEFIARFDLDDNETDQFSSGQIRNISEIGLVFPEEVYEERITDILSYYHLDYFSKQPPLEKFHAIGDDKGLFICVPENRPWFPASSSLSGCYPIKIHFKTNGKEFIYNNT